MALSDDERPLVTAGLGTLCRPSTAQSWTAGATPGYYGRVVANQVARQDQFRGGRLTLLPLTMVRVAAQWI